MRLRQDSLGHARLIESVLKSRGDISGVVQAVRHSWSRCLSTYSLDPLQVKKPVIVEHSELQQRRERIGPVLPIARIEMLGLSKHMVHSQYGIMLTDRDGVILSYVGDPAFSMTARRSGFREGAVWSEQELGTNGMGTCLMTQEPIVIHRSDHFLVQNTGLTCSAAPIFDPQGQVIAALDISGCSSGAQTHTLALVEIAAQNIENRAMLSACRSHHMVRFHRCLEFVGTPGEGVLVFDEGGTVLGANRSALELLGYADHKSLCGQSVSVVLETPLANLLHLGMRHGLRPEPLTTRTGHQRLFAAVQPPADEARRTPKSVVVGTRPSDALDALQPTDPVMVRNVQILRRVLNRDISVLLLGETGTGKGYFAKAIHNASRRADKPFVAVNCAAIPEMLIESELFGYKPGAFTGATREGSPGRILQANGGTLFLDEIGDMPLALQARLLTVIEEREVVPLGASKPIAVDIRVISATHRDPVDLIGRSQFRDDLYYRLNGITLTIPPLRERKDAADVVRYMLRIEAGERTPVQIEEALVQRLARYSWPGNIRQLRNVLCMMLALRESDYLTLDDFDESWLTGSGSRAAREVPAASAAAGEADVLSDAEREALLRTLEACHWNVSAAATRLHLSRKTMYRKMHRHGLSRRDALGEPAVAAGTRQESAEAEASIRQHAAG